MDDYETLLEYIRELHNERRKIDDEIERIREQLNEMELQRKINA